MDDVRLIDANHLEKKMLRYAHHTCHETTSTAESCAEMVRSAPTIVPDVQRWRKTAEDRPTRKDGNEIGSILCAGYHCNIRDGMWLENIMPWHVVRDNPGMFPLWMPLPKLPDLSVPERRCMMGND